MDSMQSILARLNNSPPSQLLMHSRLIPRMKGKYIEKWKKKKEENFYINSFKELRANELVNGGLLTVETKKKKKSTRSVSASISRLPDCVKGAHTKSLPVNRASPTKNNWRRTFRRKSLRSKNMWRIENFLFPFPVLFIHIQVSQVCRYKIKSAFVEFLNDIHEDTRGCLMENGFIKDWRDCDLSSTI